MSGTRESPGAGRTAHGAGVVTFGKLTAPHSAKPSRKASLRGEGPAGRFTVIGQTAKALAAFVAAGERGVTALEAASWAYRLAAYVHDLRHKCGLAIETLREAHEGGSHARYVLRSPVRLEREPEDWE